MKRGGIKAKQVHWFISASARSWYSRGEKKLSDRSHKSFCRHENFVRPLLSAFISTHTKFWTHVFCLFKDYSTIDEMRFKNYLGYASSPVISICTGVLSTILWFGYACSISRIVFPMKSERFIFQHQAMDFSTFVSSLACAVISVLLIFGVIKKIANYIIPWLAIHFACLLYIFPLTLQTMVFFVIDERKRTMTPFVLPIIFTAALMYSWGIVYLYCKSLITSIQVQTTYPEEGKILETPNEPEKQPV